MSSLDILELVVVILLVLLLLWVVSSNGYFDLKELIKHLFVYDNDDFVDSMKIIRGI